MSPSTYLVSASRLVTCDPARATEGDPLGVIEDGALLVDAGVVRAVGAAGALFSAHPDLPVAFSDPRTLVTPGLVDAHTHLPWAGSRDREYALRMAGADYEAIARAGGGIVASRSAIREVDREALAAIVRARLGRMASLGVTTVEAKSGYGLDEEGERKQLGALADVAGASDLPRVVATYLALHAVPPEAPSRDAYAKEVCDRVLPAILADGLATYVDAYVDRSAFSVAQAAPVLGRARALGAGVRLHIGQFADVGGAALAARVGAASADHLEHLGDGDEALLAGAGVRAVLLPVASFTLGQPSPDVTRLRAAGVGLVVASDANPGTAPTESLPLAMALAVKSYGLSVAEAILGATREAAASLGLGDVCGVIREGASADLAVWDLPHEAALIQPWGVARARSVLRAGRVIAGEG